MRIASPLTTEPQPILQWIEVATSLQIPSFHVIGLPSPEVAEARERVRAAIESSDFEFPRRRVVLNLSPASIRKRGTGSDLAMALGILLAASNAPSVSDSFPIVASGELGLDGKVKPVGHVMRTLYASWQAGVDRIFLAPEDHSTAVSYLSLLKRAGLFVGPAPGLVSVTHLAQAWMSIFDANGAGFPRLEPGERGGLRPLLADASDPEDPSSLLLPLDPVLERWITVAASGQHHLLLLGPRGAGKSHALEWFVRLQPRASAETQIKNILIRELLGSKNETLIDAVPARRVGTQVRPSALSGGTYASSMIRPGEFSLAHGGVLLADELPEWPRDSREALREPLERGKITITRSQASVELPADFTLIANGNLCPCGGWPRLYPRIGTHSRASAGKNLICHCEDGLVRNYMRRLSGPILDRIDIIQLIAPHSAPSGTNRFSLLRDRVADAHHLAFSLWGSAPGLLKAARVEELLNAHPPWKSILGSRQSLSFRTRHKVTRVALSLAIHQFLENKTSSPEPKESHFEEAFYQRPEGINLFGAQEAQQAP